MHAHRAWREASCPSEGPLLEEKGRLSRSVRRMVRLVSVLQKQIIQWESYRMCVSGARGWILATHEK